MTEQRFKLEVRSGCIIHDAVGVRIKGEDDMWRYWIELNGRCIPGTQSFPPTRAGHVRLKACAAAQLERLIWPARHTGLTGDAG